VRPRHVRARTAVLVLALVLSAVASGAEVLWLRNGDRLTGTIVSETPKTIRLKLPFATILVPKSQVERVVRADGKEEVLNPREAAPSPAPTPPPPAPRLVLAVTGASFWCAWDHKSAPADPSLRLEMRIDEQPVASWTDSHLDPEDLPGAVVNTFAFTSGDEAGAAAPGVLLSPPEAQPGRVLLRVELPAVSADRHTVRVAYQVNEGTVQSPAWREVATTAAPVVFRADAPTVVQLRQQRGQMEFSRKRMRGVETFGMELAPE
jgi:hypothetical protein